MSHLKLPVPVGAICPFCGSNIETGFKYCGECGREIPSVDLALARIAITQNPELIGVTQDNPDALIDAMQLVIDNTREAAQKQFREAQFIQKQTAEIQNIRRNQKRLDAKSRRRNIYEGSKILWCGIANSISQLTQNRTHLKKISLILVATLLLAVGSRAAYSSYEQNKAETKNAEKMLGGALSSMCGQIIDISTRVNSGTPTQDDWIDLAESGTYSSFYILVNQVDSLDSEIVERLGSVLTRNGDISLDGYKEFKGDLLELRVLLKERIEYPNGSLNNFERLQELLDKAQKFVCPV